MSGAAFSLDTSVVVRLLVGQPAGQYESASCFLREQAEAGEEVHVCDLVLAEAYVALQGFYHMPKKDALEALRLFVRHGGVAVSRVAQDVLADSNLASAKPGFVDRLIHGAAVTGGRTLVTFEKAGRKLAGAVVLE